MLGDNDMAIIGKRVILPSSFIVSPATYATIIARCFEYRTSLWKTGSFYYSKNKARGGMRSKTLFLPGQSASERPDLATRVFRLKLKDLDG